jgi:adenosylhomocysteine nucleosidase
VSRPLAILAALPDELAPLVRALESEKVIRVGGLDATLGVLDGNDVALAACGIGKVNAAIGATVLCTSVGPRGLAFAGVAGGISSDLAIGDLVVATRIVDGDYGRATDEGRVLYRPGAIPLPHLPPGDPALVLDERMAAGFADRLATLALPAVVLRPGQPARPPAVHLGTLATTDAFVASERVRDAIGGETGAAALEMEGAAVAQVAERFGLPWLVVRAVSDRAGTDSGLDFQTFLPLAAASAAVLLRHLLPVFPDDPR